MAKSKRSSDAMKQIYDERMSVDFDTYDTSLSDLQRRFEAGRIDVTPDYQRFFVWDHERQSRLIESLLLGIPVPDLFMAYDAEGQDAWEVVDGVQRVTSIIGFLDPENKQLDDDVREKLTRKLTGLKKLTKLNGKSYEQLDQRVKNFLDDRFLKIVLLNDKSQSSVKYELFERLNTGGIILEDQEIRNVVYRGSFTEMLHKLAASEKFSQLVRDKGMGASKREEYVLKFFAYRDWYQEFEHSVVDFLKDYTKAMHSEFSENPSLCLEYEKVFDDTFQELGKMFPSGINRGRKNTPVNLFEAITVAASYAIDNGDTLIRGGDQVLLDDELKRLTTGATNSARRVRGRIEEAYSLMTGQQIELE